METEICDGQSESQLFVAFTLLGWVEVLVIAMEIQK